MKLRLHRPLSAALLSVMVLANAQEAERPLPHSDPSNEGGWVYNEAISDEFEADQLDEDRWFIVGKFVDGKPTYVHPDDPKKFVWKGRAPSQFSGRNHRLEDGVLILETRWEPDFPFETEIRKPNFGEPTPYENITTPSLIQRREFTYGYMEARAKVADAEINSAFWTIGKGLEIDIFELFGDGRIKGKEHLDTQLWWSIRDWGKLKGQPAYTERRQLDFRPADDFHVYGLEWNPDGVRYFLDGKLIADVSADQVREWAKANNEVDDDYDGWVADRPLVLWLDMETFPWHGVPDSLEDLEANSPEGENKDGKVEFKVDYVRLWQRAKPGE
ncbi:family 16 glycosylhydrolase [Erythrobacter sp. F6033]|uniref:family 16 glycosylhydrolase n=1 Tax=Erythrobacter sp. F6033 TaxID=2926401 RepID=UPI001FF564D5|nr:family 16 glycosylhydrolase [Erythrobacter sp. F6033]MCK0129297.1 family 16 glycosylhydrolase [Erythrobacter sp. F6033]